MREFFTGLNCLGDRRHGLRKQVAFILSYIIYIIIVPFHHIIHPSSTFYLFQRKGYYCKAPMRNYSYKERPRVMRYLTVVVVFFMMMRSWSYTPRLFFLSLKPRATSNRHSQKNKGFYSACPTTGLAQPLIENFLNIYILVENDIFVIVVRKSKMRASGLDMQMDI